MAFCSGQTIVQKPISALGTGKDDEIYFTDSHEYHNILQSALFIKHLTIEHHLTLQFLLLSSCDKAPATIRLRDFTNLLPTFKSKFLFSTLS